MLPPHHRTALQEVLENKISPRALKAITTANVRQDALRGQIGHDEYHFDNNALAQSYAYIETNRTLIAPALKQGRVTAAWAAFGRLTHTAQDFYAHTNYIRLWMAQFDADSLPPVAAVPHADPNLLRHPELHSGKLYYPLELLSYIPPLRRFILPRLPKDSHAWMNLDSPKQSAAFDYAYAAAVRQTADEWDKTVENLSEELLAAFCG
ncbi:MAG: hypothetical protein L3J16_05000 [Anaerolineales bacterium]|nr:hypothetical protein [Anaerolineales bacterium]